MDWPKVWSCFSGLMALAVSIVPTGFMVNSLCSVCEVPSLRDSVPHLAPIRHLRAGLSYAAATRRPLRRFAIASCDTHFSLPNQLTGGLHDRFGRKAEFL